MTDARLSFVTVVFESEFPMLLLQAASVARFLPEALALELVVIDNSAKGMGARRRAALLSAYGDRAPLVRIARPADICAVPPALGWRSQQVLKLAIADQLTGTHYVVLDAKNHFIATPEVGFFLAPDGRARVNVYSYETHPLRPAFENVMAYLHLPVADHVGSFTATVTPFVLDVALVKALMSDIAARSGRSFADEFIREELLEFFLYSGWIVSRGTDLTEVFDFHQVFSPNIWPRGAGTEQVAQAIDKARTGRAPLFSVHRGALAQLDHSALALLSAFWCERGLFSSAADAGRFVGDFRKNYARAEWRRKARSIPYRVSRTIKKRRSS